MLRNREIRTKLVCILLVPIAGLVALSASQAWQRYGDAPGADRPAARQELERSLLQLAIAGASSVAFALVASRIVSRPLRRLTISAQTLADEHLPEAITRLRSPADEDVRYLSTVMSPMEVNRRDEIGQLTTALNRVQSTAVDLAAEHASLIRKGIANAFVDLARANQGFVDAQLSELDELEMDERDPLRLERLFRVDHLAIRARRSVESLLVLAGVDRERDLDDAVPVLDIVRAAVAQVEHLTRVQVLRVDAVAVGPDGAIDLAHLVAELIDAGLRSSPAETSVEIRGHPGRSGYVLSVSDAGIGMSGDRMAALNALLAHPPIPALTPAEHVGYAVAGRLASRHGMTIRLAPGPDAGVVALVSIPASVLHGRFDAPAGSVPEAAFDRLALDGSGGGNGAVEGDPEDLDSLLSEGWADGWDDVSGDSEDELDEAGAR